AARAKLHAVLKGPFNLDDAATEELIDAAIAADHDAIDFYHFTSLINRTLDDDARRRIVGMMWEMVYFDGKATEFEDNVMWRVPELLNVPARERIALRRRVSGEETREDERASRCPDHRGLRESSSATPSWKLRDQRYCNRGRER